MQPEKGLALRTAALTALAMVAFAANSLLCRLALDRDTIDPVGFAAVRLAAGAVTLLGVVHLRGTRRSGSLLSGLVLALYVLPFSLAYVSLAAGTGALILFGAVQSTMIVAGLRAGERPLRGEWLGLLLALGGLGVLAAPGLARPSPLGAALMALAGVAWGVYSLRGRWAAEPIAETTGNFLWSLPVVALALLAGAPRLDADWTGVLLAVTSGALTSGLGYVVWYAALAGLTATRAALVQLTVPVLAATGGVVLLGEVLSLRLLVAAVLILGGVALATSATARRSPAAAPPAVR